MFSNQLSKKTDEALMMLVQGGSDKAMAELYRRYAKLLLRYFYRMLFRKEAIAQDFLHDLFVKIIERSDQYKPEYKFSTWLYSSAHNMCKNEYRKMALRGNTSIEHCNAYADDINDQYAKREFKAALDATLDKMEEVDKNLFVLRHELELSVEEIAAMLQCPEGTVKSRLFYLKKKLAKNLQVFQI